MARRGPGYSTEEHGTARYGRQDARLEVRLPTEASSRPCAFLMGPKAKIKGQTATKGGEISKNSLHCPFLTSCFQKET